MPANRAPGIAGVNSQVDFAVPALDSRLLTLDSALVFGGYGVFGGHVARELAKRGIAVCVAGRDAARAAKAAAELGKGHTSLRADVSDRESCLAAVEGKSVAVNCAGPFQQLNASLLEACLERCVHYVDITDDRRYAAMVREYGPRFADANLAAVYGASSLPSISLALAHVALRAASGERASAEVMPRVKRVYVTLFIGNDNPKGQAAVRSAVESLGKSISAPQGTLRGLGDRRIVELPPPFGRKAAANFDCADYDLLAEATGAREVVVQASFEMPGVLASIRLFSTCAPRLGKWLLPKLAGPGFVRRIMGCSAGIVQVELLFDDGGTRRAAIVAPRDGQRMASLPCVLAVEALLQKKATARGAMTACDLLGAESLIEGIVAEGFELEVDPSPAAIRPMQ